MEEWSGEPRREDGPDLAGGGAGDVHGAVAVDGGGDDAAPLMEPEFVSGSAPPSPPEPYRPMARRRLALLTVAAVVLGVVAGAAAGYKVQQDRTPTPLPKLIAAPPTQPAAPGPAPSTADATQDRNAVYEANLLKLLVPTPKGAKETERTWLDMSDVADEYQDPTYMYGVLGKQGFRRAAVVDWETGRHSSLVTTEVSLTQFRDDERAYASDWLRNLESPDGAHQTYGDPLPDHTDSLVMPSSLPYEDPEGDYYVGQAFARVGTIVVEVYVSGLHPVTAKTLTNVITKQLERL